MDFAAHYEMQSPAVVAEDFDGDVVILNLDDGCYFSLEGAGTAIWNALIAGATPRALVDGATSFSPMLADATRQFLQRLCELRLIRLAEPSVGSPTINWESLAEAGAPRIEVFDDLAELILADPIHDVDAEAGWPLRRNAA